MTFKLSNATSYEWPVAGEIAGVRFSFKGQFAFLRQDRIEELIQQLSRRQKLLEIGQDDPTLTGVHARAVAVEVLVGWSGVIDDDAQPVLFSPATLERMIQLQGIAIAITDAWAESLQGARQGNSGRPRGIG